LNNLLPKQVNAQKLHMTDEHNSSNDTPIQGRNNNYFPKSLSGFRLVPKIDQDQDEELYEPESDDEKYVNNKNTETRFGMLVESKKGKMSRAYLMPSEVGARNRNNRLKGSDISKAYTFSNPPPNMKFRVPDNFPFPITQEFIINNFLTTSTTIPAFGAANFAVGNLDQLTSLQAVFDQYIIDFIEVWVEPNLGTGVGGAAGQAGANGIATVIDYDDSNALTTFPQALDYTNVLHLNISECHYRKWKPHIAVASYSGAFTSFANIESPWIDAASSSVQHYGIKAAAGVTNVSIIYSCKVRLNTRWRNVR